MGGGEGEWEVGRESLYNIKEITIEGEVIRLIAIRKQLAYSSIRKIKYAKVIATFLWGYNWLRKKFAYDEMKL